jgi:tight adherence protein B
MMFLAEAQDVPLDETRVLLNSVLMFIIIVSAVFLGGKPFVWYIRTKEDEYDDILNRALLLDIPPRLMTVLTGLMVILFGFIFYLLFRGSMLAMFLAGLGGFFVTPAFIRYLRRRRLKKLEDQLVSGIQSLASGVRAGLNLVQSMQMVARDAPSPIRQEFAHMVREYEYGISLDLAMNNAAERIGSANYRLLFSALLTHRERGGNLGETLDDIAASIREIQRLEGRVQTLTAQGRATARWLGILPGAVLIFLYIFRQEDTLSLFTEPVGNIILGSIFIMNVIGFVWIRKIMDIDL